MRFVTANSLLFQIDIHHWARKRHRLRRHPPRCRPPQGQDTLITRSRLGKDMALSRQRQPAAVDWPRKGRHPPCARRRRQRSLGSVGKDAQQARLAHRRRHDARGIRPMH